MSVVPPPVAAPPASARRDVSGWFFLAILFLLLLLAAMVPEGHDMAADRLAAAQTTLRSAMVPSAFAGIATGRSMGGLEDLEKEETKFRQSSPIDAEIYAATRAVLQQPLGADDFHAMDGSKDPVDHAAADIFRAKTLSRADAERLSTGMGKRGFLGRLIRAQAFAKAGDRGPMAKLQTGSAIGLGAVSICGVVFAGAAFAAWLFVSGGLSSGSLKPKGLPTNIPTLFDADRLAARAAALLAMFLVISLLPTLWEVALHVKLEMRVAQLIISILMLLAVPILFRAPVLGRVVSLRDLGVDLGDFRRTAGIGVLGYLLELPVALALATLGETIFRNFTHSHPAAVELVNSHDALTIVSVIFAASVLAPFWEEIMFRGLLFPAITRLANGSIATGAVVSSFLFGVIHPQGVGALLALMSVAGMSCALSYYTKSLVPSMVMHGLHNTTLLIVGLLVS